MNTIKLSATFDENVTNHQNSNELILKITSNYNLPRASRNKFALLVSIDEALPAGFPIGITRKNFSQNNIIKLSRDLEYLNDGDIIKVNTKANHIRVIYRASSRFNFFLLTERCNHYCLMCSQPPKNIDDSWHLQDVSKAIELIDRGSPFIGITGGEPTLLGDDLIDLLRKSNGYLPETSVLILTNGRKFIDENYVQKISQIKHRDLTFAIPLYSDTAHIHDYVVQANGAFDETVKGILKLKEYNQKIQLRIVLHKQTYERLPRLAEFIYRNMAFVDHIALMGLEITGFTKANLNQLWIDPIEYADKLEEATLYLSRMGMNVSIFNHQLCTMPKSIWNYSVKSISDWKNNFIDECENCNVKSECGGFFTTSGEKRSAAIKSI